MSLDARVLCDCFETGKAPLPLELEGIMEYEGDNCFIIHTNDPVLKQRCHDWYERYCPHQDKYLCFEAIGNVLWVAALRSSVNEIKTKTGLDFPVVLEKTIYNGIHAGDVLDVTDIEHLQKELNTLYSFLHLIQEQEENKRLSDFLATMQRLINAAYMRQRPAIEF